MSIKRALAPFGILSNKDGADNKDINMTADIFRNRYDGNDASIEKRKAESTIMVNEYYDIVTDFYEYGWGQCFHFAPGFQGETFFESLSRHEFYLALRGNFQSGMTILDAGCGVGGPARNLVRLTGCNVMAINNNNYQLNCARRHNEKFGFSDRIKCAKMDFSHTSFKDNEFDGAYAIEATCHADDKVKVFKEILRVLKPGAYFCCYEWIITPKYDDSNAEHRRIRHGIELGNSLPTLETGEMVVEAMNKAGFIVVDAFDVVERFETSEAKTISWYSPLEPNYMSLTGIKATPLGRLATTTMCTVLEFMHLAPKGTRKTANILEEAAINLIKSGHLGIFSPCFFICGKKPE